MIVKNIAFIFAPNLPAATLYPYLSIHLLSTILNNSGYKTQKYDFNLRMNKDLLDIQLYADILEKNR